MTLVVWHLQGLLTPLIAIVALYVAWQQWRSNELKLRMERYERRLRIYQEIIKILSLVFRDANVSQEDLLQFRTMTAEADFLFGVDIPQYIDEIYTHGLKLSTASIKYRDHTKDHTPGYDHQMVVADVDKNLEWLNEQFPVAKQKFSKYLDISK